MKGELRALIRRYHRREQLTQADLIRMSELAWYTGNSGLMNPEEDAYYGAKEEWWSKASEAAELEPAVEHNGWG